ncbi:hypothetical protein AGMMS50249_1780 [candidate division SR1 bacterium]|nr:hypothetical protein AGMMS50249_1780 [candidate division SR1 bacterium]
MIISFLLPHFTSAYQEVLIEERDGKPIRVIKVILDGEHYVVSSVAKDGGETLEDLTKKVAGISSINGAFFCPKDYSSCNGQTFSNYERVFQGDGASFSRFRPDTSVRGIFGFDKNGMPLFVQNKISTHDVGLESNINAGRIGDLYFGISNFPVLLINGDDVTVGAKEYIDSKLTGKGNRNFICSTADNKTIYMGYIGLSSVRDMAPYLQKNFDCYNALFLDAGASSAMIYSGNVLEKGSRKLITDAFVVVPSSAFITLGGEVSSELTPAQPTYIMTDSDIKLANKLTKVIDAIYAKYGKATYKTNLINMFRKEVSKTTLSASKKAVYNQVLQRLFTIEKL